MFGGQKLQGRECHSCLCFPEFLLQASAVQGPKTGVVLL